MVFGINGSINLYSFTTVHGLPTYALIGSFPCRIQRGQKTVKDQSGSEVISGTQIFVKFPESAFFTRAETAARRIEIGTEKQKIINFDQRDSLTAYSHHEVYL